MALEYKTVKFPNDKEGLRQKDKSITQFAASGWRVIGELIEAGQIKGGEACCLASICLPVGFLSGRTPGSIVVTLSREPVPLAGPDTEGIAITGDIDRRFGANIGFFLGRLVRRSIDKPIWLAVIILALLVFAWFLHNHF